MNLTSERQVAAPVGRVWQTLNDPDAIRRLVPGCTRLHADAPSELSFTIGAPTAPAGHDCSGHAHVLEADPEHRVHVSFEGDGAQGGFLRGDGTAELAAVRETTVLRVTLEVHAGGALANQWPGPDAARRLMDQFMDALVTELGGVRARELGAEGAAGLVAAVSAPGASSGMLTGLLAAVPAEPFGYPRVAWIGGFLFLLIFLLIFSAYV